MGVVLVHHRHVIEHVFLRLEHAAGAVLHDERNLVSEARVVGDAVGHSGIEQVAGAVFVLQALARERGAAGGGTHQEAAGARVAAGPDEIPDALEAEARVENVERQHRYAVRAVAHRRGEPRRDRAGLGDAFLEDLAVLRFLVVEQFVAVFRIVELAHRRVDGDLPEQRLHAEGARLVGHDRHDVLAQRRVLQPLRQHLHEHHRGALLAAVGAFEEAGDRGAVGHGERGRLADALGQVAAERFAARMQVLHLGRVVGRPVKFEMRDLLVGERQREAVAEREQRRIVELLLLVRGHLALAP